MAGEKFIACGMYAFTLELRQGWQALFDRFKPLLDTSIHLRPELNFRHGEDLLRDPALFIGQTCGYPLMTRLRDQLTPFCVPCFEVPGAEDKYYSSQIIVGADSGITSLPECEGRIAAINTTDSNSGMNLLRYELVKLGANRGFFADIEITGGHLQSLLAVAEDRAQVAAIDCVTFQFISDYYPDLAARVRGIGFTAQTCGLPFVLPNKQYSPAVASHYTEALRQALTQLPAETRARLHLSRIETVGFDDYRGIMELESRAIEGGFAQLI